MRPRASSGRPRVAVLYASGSAGPRELQVASEGLCEPVLVFDSSDPWTAPLVEMLALFEPALDRAGLDLEATASALRRLDVAAVTTFSDACLRDTAVLAGLLGLPFHSEATVALLSDKVAQRRALNAAGVGAPVPAAELVSADRLPELVAELGLPLVLKPACATGSRLAVRIHDEEQARTLTALTDADGALAERFAVERLVTGEHPAAPWLGDYVSVETSVGAGAVVPLCVSDRLGQAWPLRETGFVVPTFLPDHWRAAVEAVADQAVRALGIDCGVCHVELKLTSPLPTVIEVNGRLGGGVHWLLEPVSGFDAVREALRVALGERPSPAPACRGHAIDFFPHAPAGAERVTALPTPAELRAVPGVWSARPNRAVGDAVDWRVGDDHRLYDVFVEAQDLAALRRSLDELERIFAARASFALRSEPVLEAT
jgi:biotin carboxylase